MTVICTIYNNYLSKLVNHYPKKKLKKKYTSQLFKE